MGSSATATKGRAEINPIGRSKPRLQKVDFTRVCHPRPRRGHLLAGWKDNTAESGGGRCLAFVGTVPQEATSQEAALPWIEGVVLLVVFVVGVFGFNVLAEYAVGALGSERLEQTALDSVDGDRAVGGVGEGEC